MKSLTIHRLMVPWDDLPVTPNSIFLLLPYSPHVSGSVWFLLSKTWVISSLGQQYCRHIPVPCLYTFNTVELWSLSSIFGATVIKMVVIDTMLPNTINLPDASNYTSPFWLFITLWIFMLGVCLCLDFFWKVSAKMVMLFPRKKIRKKRHCFANVNELVVRILFWKC